DRDAREQGRRLALKHRVRRDVDEDVEVARGCAIGAGLTLAVETDSRAVVDTRGYLDFEGLNFVHPALAATFAARMLDDLSAAVAGRAWTLDDEQALLRTNLAIALAQLAAAPRSAWRSARAAARLAGDRNLDLYIGRLAVERIFEADFHVVAQIGAAPRAAACRTGSPERAAEDGLENIAQV